MIFGRHRYEPYVGWRSWDATSLARIGFFDDGLDSFGLQDRMSDSRWGITPIHHLKPGGLKTVILCATGAFSPFHPGHLRMMEIARRQVESEGRFVAGGYIVPDHDAYVSSKANGAAACPASERIYQAQVALKDHPWIQVDPWAALYQDRALNYTTILARLQALVGDDYQVVFVFGSDNEGFKGAFHSADWYVCVGRPGHRDPHPEALAASSTEMRAKGMAPRGSLLDDKRPYLIRDDLRWASRQWQSGVIVRRKCVEFMEGLFEAFYGAFGVYPEDIPVECQDALVDSIPSWLPHISFDRVTSDGAHWISRVFRSGALQDKPISWLHSDLSAIPPGRYALIEDDIASGSTVAKIRELTPQVEWTHEVSLASWARNGEPCFDIVDARDFLFGARDAGLWIDDGNGTVCRAPYISPWVNLMTRASIPPEKQLAFVKAVIEANIKFFSGTSITVGDTHNQAFWLKLGYNPLDTMEEVSKSLLTWTQP